MISKQRQSLLSSQARVQTPWVKVTIGDYTFGVYNKKEESKKNSKGFYKSPNTNEFPNYIQRLTVTKINGKVNQYVLSISYPVTQFDDPNFFEKVFSSVSDTRKITFSYGDASTPSFTYKDEEAIITNISQSFNLTGSSISYTVNAVSSAVLIYSGCYSFTDTQQKVKPSEIIKEIILNSEYKLGQIFTGMPTSKEELSKFIAGDDQYVEIEPKTNISILDYITYLASCMIPLGTTADTNISNDIYILTIHDETSFDNIYGNPELKGPYFKITKTSYKTEQNDAYELDIGYNTSTIVSQFNIEKNENYSILYNYQKEVSPEQFVKRLNMDGEWEDFYAPSITSKNEDYLTTPTDISWWTKITKYPINATIVVQGLLRPAMLMTHLRLNVIFPGGHKHISSGLYIVTKQIDTIDSSGYKTQLSLTKISGDNLPNDKYISGPNQSNLGSIVNI